MSQNSRVTTTDSLGTDTIEPIVREVLVILAMVAFIAVGSILPGTGLELPGTAISIGDLVVAVGSLGIVGSLLWAGSKLRAMVRTNLEGPAAVLKGAASIVRYLAVFAAVLLAHWGFAPMLVPILDSAWAWDAGFLVFALVPLGVIAARLYNFLDPLATFLTVELVGEGNGGTTEPTAPSDDSEWS